jgi:uncharacterized membrane protein
MLSMRHLYWIITSLVLAIALHAGFVLAVPGYALQRSLASLVEEPGTNRFFIVPPEHQARLFPAYPASSVFGACAYDVAQTAVALSASLPEGMWTLTIYSASGDAVYSLNDRQSGTNRFTVKLSLAPSLLDMLSQVGGEDLSGATGWEVETPEPTGLALIWVPAQEKAMRRKLEDILAESRCSPAG